MILSERHRFVFIKGMKVAGTSVEMALAAICGPSDIVTPISPIDELERIKRGPGCRNYASDPAFEQAYMNALTSTPVDRLAEIRQPPLRYYNHMPLTEVLKKYGKPLDGFRIVCVERSPYSKVISWANMRVSYGAYRVGGAMRADIDAIQAQVDKGFETGAILAARNIDRYRDLSGKLVAQPMRYASLDTDFAAFVRALGIDPAPALPHAKKGLLSDSLDPRDVLRPDQVAKINETFAEEFSVFGYPTL